MAKPKIYSSGNQKQLQNKPNPAFVFLKKHAAELRTQSREALTRKALSSTISFMLCRGLSQRLEHILGTKRIKTVE